MSITRKKSLIYLFNEVDSDGKGYFTCEQLRAHIQEAGQADEAFAQLDSDGDGRVTLEDFLCAHERLPLCKDEMQYVLESDGSTMSTTISDDRLVQFPSETHGGTMWKCFRDKLSQDCPELINGFDQLLQEVMNDYEQQETSFERQKEESRTQLQQLGELFDEQVSDTQQQLLDQAKKMVEQKELQNVLNHKQEEVLSLQEKVEVLEAQVRSRQQSRDRLATDLQLAEEEKKLLQEQLQVAKLDNENADIHHADNKEHTLPLSTSESSLCRSSDGIVTPLDEADDSWTTLPCDSKESITSPPHSSTDTMVTPPQSMTNSPHHSRENVTIPPNKGHSGSLSSDGTSSSAPLEEGKLLNSSPGTPNHTFKILLLGDQSVGKTAILNRICNNSFNLQYRATIGVEFSNKYMLLDEKVIALKLWDTAGQERFKSITRSYIRGTNGLLMVYDITNLDSFHSVSEWINSAMDCADKSLLSIMLLGNKADMTSLRAVSHDAGREVARQYKCGHYEVSAKTGDNVVSSLITMVKMMIAMETEQNTSRNIIHLHNHASESVHTHKCCLSHS